MYVEIRETPLGGDVDDFLNVVDYLYRDDPCWVRPLDMDLKRSDLDLTSMSSSSRSAGTPVSVAPSRSLGAASTYSTQTESLAIAGPIPFARTEITNTTDAPNRTHGKIFMFEGSTPTYVCSGTVVNSPTKNIVWTAGHCVHEGGPGGTYFDDFAFVPGRRNGSSDLGVWFADKALTTNQWRQSEDEETMFQHDVGALVMEPLEGVEIADAVGARGIRFNQSPDQLYDSFGYPAEAPFDGEKLWLCDSDPGMQLGTGSLAFMGIGCDMTGGSSGGGWIVDGGFVQSVNSFGILNDPDYEEVMFGPQMKNAALGVYNSAVSAGGPDTSPPKLTKISDGPDPFTPLGRRKRATKIKFSLNETARVAFVIKKRSGVKVWKIPRSKLEPARYYVKWNGRHFKTGKVVKAGVYKYKITATDLAGNTASKSGKVRVKR